MLFYCTGTSTKRLCTEALGWKEQHKSAERCSRTRAQRLFRNSWMISDRERSQHGFARNVTTWAGYRSGARLLFGGLLLCVSFIGTNLSSAQNSKTAADSSQLLKDRQASEFRIPLLTEPLRLADFPDMHPGPDLEPR